MHLDETLRLERLQQSHYFYIGDVDLFAVLVKVEVFLHHNCPLLEKIGVYDDSILLGDKHDELAAFLTNY